MATTRRTPFALLALGVAALLSSWNPASAPMALILGLLAGALCLKARREEGRTTPVLRAALAMAVAAAVVGGAVIARAAIAGRISEGRPLVEGIPGPDRQKALDRAADETRSSRESARKELDAVGPAK